MNNKSKYTNNARQNINRYTNIFMNLSKYKLK